MKVRGILRGQSIELLEPIGRVPEGVEVTVEIDLTPIANPKISRDLTDAERLARLNRLFGTWRDRPDLDEVFAHLDRVRHGERGRKLTSFDS
ncbi:MAG: hypothetical protein AAFY15_02905 [Cyanobacteria bacterium J06648_11]